MKLHKKLHEPSVTRMLTGTLGEVYPLELVNYLADQCDRMNAAEATIKNSFMHEEDDADDGDLTVEVSITVRRIRGDE